MPIVTQTEIDSAVLLGKNAMMKLANELYLERKYGDNPECCNCTLLIIHGWVKTLSCINEVVATAVRSEGNVKFNTSVVDNVINVFANDVNISGAVTLTSTDVDVTATALAARINAFQSTYAASAYTGGNVRILGASTGTNVSLKYTNAGGLSASSITVDQFSGGKAVYSEDSNCLDETETKELIGKINSLCS